MWFDYRLITEQDAFLYFVRCFDYAFISYEKKVRLRKYRNYLTQLNKISQIENWKWYNTMQILKKIADSYDITYPDYWHFAFNTIIDWNFRQIFPNVFKNQDLQKNIIKKEKSKYKQEIKISSNEYFLEDNFVGDDLQKEYYTYLLQQIFYKRGLKTVNLFIAKLHNIKLVEFLNNKKQELL